jgi:predicted aldo/keto reductase-like oxidoreductase
MVFSTLGEMSSNVKDFIDLAMDYGAEHLGKSMAASTIDRVRQALKKRYRAQLSMASWRGHANLS